MNVKTNAMIEILLQAARIIFFSHSPQQRDWDQNLEGH